ARHRPERRGARLQRARRAAVPGERDRRHPPRHRRLLQGRLAQEHLQRLDLERAGARLAHRPRRRCVFQRCARAGGAAGQTLTAVSYQLSAISYQLSAIGYQLSAIGYRLTAFGSQLSAIGPQLSALSAGLHYVVTARREMVTRDAET